MGWIAKLQDRFEHRILMLRGPRFFQGLLSFIPFGWYTLFLIIPFLLIVKISFATPQIAIPPYSGIIEYTKDHVFHLYITFTHYYTLLKNEFYYHALIQSLRIATISTFLCLVMGYSLAYAIAQMSTRLRPYLLLLVALPFWISFLIRIYAWMSLLSRGGLINQLLLSLGIINHPIEFLGNEWAVCMSIVYCYLPFMVFPIYNSIVKIPPQYLEAAYNLGCRPWKAFWRITLPLSKNGIKAGVILVFLPAVGEFVIPELVGGGDTMMIGRVIWFEFFNNRNWPLACAIAVVLVLVFVVIIYWLKHKEPLDG